MLDTTTKKRIDDCRDILVGKLPDPKAQIEQITIGLIYKFMDDMDKEAIDLGGKAKFFADYSIPDPENPKKKKTVPFSQYSWDNLFNTKVTAAEMLRLYSEAIAGMDKNPNIPQLFRDIFKNAFLPYRDPETLKLFLKTIGEFEYTHSEKLGDAFEYLLSVMGSQGDAGQFRTPRHIIDFLVAVVNPGKKDTILDPACGTAGFLISAFKHIKGKAAMHGGSLTPDERKKLIQNFTGYDISPDMVRLSLVNLYLHGFNNPHIWEYDTLSSEERWDETADVILANPPFMSPKGGIRPHKKFSISSNRSEVLFVDYIAEHLNPKGRAGIIVPEGVIFQSGTAYKELRKMLVENYLYAVVSLPAGVFNPYSGVKTSILLMDRELAKTSNEILFVKIENDGYGLGAQRTPVKGSQLEEAIGLIQQFKEGGFTESELAHAVVKNEIAKNGDYNLSGERYKGSDGLGKQEFPIVKLKDLCELVRGVTYSKNDEVDKDGLKILRANNITISDTLMLDDVKQISKSVNVSEDQKLFKGDIFICVASGSSSHIGKVAYITEDLDYYFGGFMGVIRVTKKVDAKYLFYNLRGERFNDYLNRVIAGANIKNINKQILGDFNVPLPPLSIQEEIVAEIESWQKIIDGAKAVIDNYKPKIDINPDWDKEKLGDISEFKNGLNFSKQSDGEYIKILGVSHFKDRLIAPVSELEKIRVNEIINDNYLLKKGDIVFVRSNGNKELVGRSLVIPEVNERISFSGFTIRCRLKKGIEPLFIGYLFKSDFHSKLLQNTGRGANISNLSQEILNDIVIPIPPIETQRQIVSQIEKEQVLVNANKQLIEIFEQKIKNRIAKVWGSDNAAPVLYGENDELTMAAEE